MTLHTQQSSRQSSLDALRGFLVLGMMLAHAIFFLYSGKLQIFSGTERILNVTIFTMFVFVSGMTQSLWLDRHLAHPKRHMFLRTIRRSFTLYLGYILVAFLAIVAKDSVASFSDLATQMKESFLMIHLLNFTEYIPFFIFLPLLTFPFLHLFNALKRSIILTLLFSAVSFALGVILYPIDLPYPYMIVKNILIGTPGALYFPLLFYLPVYVLGSWWQHQRSIYQDSHILSFRKLLFIMCTVSIALLSIIISAFTQYPFLSSVNRWPPSIGFLATGITSGVIVEIILGMQIIPYTLYRAYAYVVYLGRDAYDIWISHLSLLFLYHHYIGRKTDSVLFFILCYVLLVAASTLLSSITLTNGVSVWHIGPVSIQTHDTKRIRKRYLLVAFFFVLLLSWSFAVTPMSQYGNIVEYTPKTEVLNIRTDDVVTIKNMQKWYVKHTGSSGVIIHITLSHKNSDLKLKIDPKSIDIYINNKKTPHTITISEKNIYTAVIPVEDLSPNIYRITATVTVQGVTCTSNETTVRITEPLYVAWTFDWEGWEVADHVLTEMQDLSVKFGNIPYTHFINPRMFLSQDEIKDRGAAERDFLLKRHESGDEIALHLHMQYDLVKAAGITPKTTNHWGLMSNEGYDVPMTQYTPDEFRQVLYYALTLMRDNSLPVPTGFRAGGWFINGPLLQILSEEGFLYDSSARDKPISGSFRSIPWNLPKGIQPYFPDLSDQNSASSQSALMEIPNNGASTYEFDSDELISRFTAILGKGILTKPQMIVYVSHPQFSATEFSKIPMVLSAILKSASKSDSGPVIFSTVSDIYSLWNSLH